MHPWIQCNSRLPSCKCSHRSRPLPLIGWAVWGPLSIRWLWWKTISSSCITCPTWCRCRPSLGSGWTSTSWAPGTVSDVEKHTLTCKGRVHIFFPIFWPCVITLRGPLQTYMVLNLLHTLMPALDSRFSETANTLSVALGDTDGVSPHSESWYSTNKK